MKSYWTINHAKVKGQIMCFLQMNIGRGTFKLCKYIRLPIMTKFLNNVSCHLDPKAKVKGQKMYFLVNASPPNLLNVATSNSVGLMMSWSLTTHQSFWVISVIKVR